MNRLHLGSAALVGSFAIACGQTINGLSLGGGADFASSSRTFQNAGAEVDWIEFTFFNTATNPNLATDFYIRSMEIIPVPEPGSAALATVAGVGVLAAARRRKNEGE